MDLERPRSWVEEGVMIGSPPPPERRVTFDNWMEPPLTRWSFLHMREIAPTARVACGAGPAAALPRDERDLSGFAFRHRGEDVMLRQMMDATYVDGLMVIHNGAVIFEDYIDGMDATTTHICQSVSKSLTATLTGVLVGQGRFDLDATVPDFIAELRGTCWDGCSMRDLLDMRAGVAFDESDYEDPESESWRGFRAMGWLPQLPDDPDPFTYVAQMHNQSEHGGAFEYRSVLTDVLGWCMERATGESFADLFGTHLWGPMGAQQDADFMVGPGGFPLTDGGFCVTLPDLARFGLMHLQEGEIDGRRVVPAEWIRRLRVRDAELIDAFKDAPEHHDFPEGGFYHDQWWVLDAEAGVYSGYGIHGQQVLIHHPSRTVVARFSSWPRPWDDDYAELADRAVLALCEALGRGANPEEA